MDFLDPDKKRKHSKRLFLGYFLMAIAVALASVILLFVAYGYDLDHHTGKVIQNGLIFINAHPDSATVLINGKEQGKTDSRLTLPAGDYTIELKRDGYLSWKRTLSLEGSSIERLVYPLLFPEKLSPQELQTYATAPLLSIQSPDRRWVLIQQNGSITKFDELDTNNPKNTVVTLALPDKLLTASKDDKGLSLVEWSTDNRHVTLKHSFADKTEFVLLDRETPTSSVNLNKQLGADPTTIDFRDKKYDQYYVFDQAAATLKSGDLKTKSLTAVASGVLNFKPYKADTILYSTKDTADVSKQSIHLHEANEDYILATVPLATPAQLDLAEYDSHLYIAVGLISAGRVFIYRDPLSQLKSKPTKLPNTYGLLKLDNVANISFAATAQFLSAQQGNHFAVFDFEANKRYYYDVPLTIPAGTFATWMDGHRMALNVDNKLTVFDFNGINQRTLVPISATTKPLFDRDYTRLFTLSPSTISVGKTALQYTSLKVGQQ